MGRNCAVKSCPNFRNGPKDSRVHTFPTSLKSLAVREKWIQAVFPRSTNPVDRDKYLANAGVCSKHFSPSDYRNGTRNEGPLKPCAVPVLELDLTVQRDRSLRG
jgi:hypothetical protein